MQVLKEHRECLKIFFQSKESKESSLLSNDMLNFISMKVALAHDYLNQWGGAERVLEVLSKMFPDAPIYTLLYDEEKTLGTFKDKEVITNFLDKPRVRQNHRPFIPLMPLAARFLKVPDDYDLLISSSAGFAKGIRVGPKTKHLSYIHTPLRYAWEPTEYLSGYYLTDQLFALPNFLKRKFNSTGILFTKPILNWLRRWDYKAAQRPDILVANSYFIANKISNYYKREALVVHPPVDLNVFHPKPITDDRAVDNSLIAKNHFLAIGRFLHYKRFDLVIETFGELGFPIKIIGQGPDEKRLKEIAGHYKNIEFSPSVRTDSELRELYRSARALIFPQVEDFGLVAAESIACGTPVITYKAGGALEIVNEHSGIFFHQQTKKHLAKAVQEFIGKEADFKLEIVSEQAKKFSKDLFVQRMKEIIEHYFE